MIVLDESLESKIPPTPPKRAKGLKKKKSESQVASEHANKKLGRPTHANSIPEVLPFEATLAYVFRGSGGKATAINAARLLIHADERFKRLVYAYDNSSTTDQSAIRLEDLCEAAEMSPDEFLAATIPALWKRNVDIGRTIAAISHPAIVEAAIKSATSNGFAAVQDRKMLFDHTGFLPTKAGPSINIDNSHKTLVAGGKSVEISEGLRLPTFNESLKTISSGSAKNAKQIEEAHRLLPAASPEILEAELVQQD